MVIFKNIVDIKTGKHVNFRQLLTILLEKEKDPVSRRLSLSAILDNFGFKCVENTEDELLASVKEMVSYLNGTLVRTDEVDRLQSEFFAQFRELMISYGYPYPTKISTLIGSDYLIRNASMLLPASEELNQVRAFLEI